MTLPTWPALLMVASVVLATHGGWRAFKAQSVTPRPGIMEFGCGMAGVAMLLPRVAGVYIP